MRDPEGKLAVLNLTLPSLLKPVGAYVPYKLNGELLWLSGMIPLVEGVPYRTGRVGAEVSIEDAMECARIATLNALAWVKDAQGSLDRVEEVVRLQGFVASADNFYEQPKVLNASSELLQAIFGDDGKHTRVAVGVCMLPLNVPVEIDFIFKVKL